MSKTNKIIWRKNFSIKRCHYQMATPAIYDAINYQNKTVGKSIIKELVWIQKGVDNTGSYVKVGQLRSLVKATIPA